MRSVAHAPGLVAPRAGGFPARRAVIRWAGRMFRREWRGQLLVVALMTVAVAATIGSITIVYNTGPADNAEFGSANHLIRFDGSDPRKLEAGLAAARRWFGTIDVIGHRSVVVPGGVETVDVRAQNPHGGYGSKLLALRHGRYPMGPGEAAVTDGVATLLGLEIGKAVTLDGHRRTVVGIVENPRNLSDEFALVAPSSAGAPAHDAVLVNAGAGSIDSFQRSLGERSALAGIDDRQNNQAADALAMFAVATVFLLLAALVAAAGFAVVAQRRLRHLGMLAATGADHKHVRFVLVANGAIVGAIAAAGGTVLGLGLWVAAAPTLESAVGHRIDRLSLPWALIASAGLLAVLAAIAAAWWPGRTVARVPVMLALSGRPPKPRPARHAALAAAVLVCAGIVSLALSGRDRPPLIVGGVVATIVGCLLLGPPAIRVFAGLAGRLSIAPRLALRDLVRYQARSGAALAAVALALGIAATVVIIASAEQAKRAAEPPNLTDRQIRVYLGPSEARDVIPPEALKQVPRLNARIGQLAAELGGAAITPLRGVIQPRETPMVVGGGTRGYPPLPLTRRYPGPSYRPAAQLYVATPAMLRYLGIDSRTVRSGSDFLVDRSVPSDQLVIPSFTDRKEFHITNAQRIDVGRHLLGSDGVMPGRSLAFITADGLRRYGWKQVAAGWVVESRRPLTSDQITRARALAANAGLTVEVRRAKASYAAARAIAVAAGALLALGILAMTVGLIRSESAGDLRTLTATGATSSIRRSLTATTAGALALLGSLLGVAGAYVVLLATYHDDLGYLRDVPVVPLGIALIAVPLAAAAAGWLFAGREPRSIARSAIE